MTMPAGVYYFGDLCYVMHNEWDEACNIMFDPTNGDPGEGVFALKDGRKFAIFGTRYGDGVYDDQEGREYCVDSGSIGCILLSDIRDDTYEVVTDVGAIIDFEAPFEVSADNGVLKFGPVEIDTGWQDQEEELEA